MRTTMLATFAAAVLMAPLSAGAQTARPLPLASTDVPGLTLVSGGCGPAFHRGPFGGCRPNFGRGYGFGGPYHRGYYGYHRHYGFYR